PPRHDRPRRPLPIIALLVPVILLAPRAAVAQAWQDGVGEDTLGRFGTWPEYGPGDDNKYEDNLIARLHPDRLQRTVAGHFYELGFGARDPGEIPADPVVSVLARNWVFKRIDVDRGDCGYRLAYNALSAGFLISTEEQGCSLAPPVDFARMAYVGPGGAVVKSLTGPTIEGRYYRRAVDGDWAENWLLVWAADGGAAGVQVPILLLCSDHPDYVQWWEGELYIHFDETAGATTDVLVAFLDGIGSRAEAEVAGWSAALPADVEERCRLLSRTLLPFPSGCREEFRLDEAAGTVEVRDTYAYEPWADSWDTPVRGLAPLPPVAAYAHDRGYPVVVDPAPTDLGLPTKNGPLRALIGADTIVYGLPLAPLWTLNLVPSPAGATWSARAQRLLEQHTATLVWDLDLSTGGGAWSLSGARGQFESLLGCATPSRGFFLRRCRQVLAKVLLDFGAGGPWQLRQVPGTDHEYHYLIHFNNHPDYPGDQDCGAGAPLEYIYQYALHAGDWTTVVDAWADIEKIFHYLEIVSDWAWMASSCRDYGGGGAFLDMFPSQWMGYLSFAKLARAAAGALGPAVSERGDFAWYLASKGMVPLTQRLGFKDGYAAAYYDFTADQVCTGFGEYEPNPDAGIPGFWCGAPVGSLIDYQAKLIAGESFHPLVDQSYLRWVPQDYADLMQLAFAVNGGLAYDLSDAAWAYNKYHAFRSVGWNPTELAQMWSDMHAEDYYYDTLLGPDLPDNGFVYLDQVCRDQTVWALGNWEPGLLTEASVDPVTGTLTFRLENDGALAGDVAMTVLSRDAPIAVLIDGAAAPYDYDPDWGVVSFTVAGAGRHAGAVQVPFILPPGGLEPDAAPAGYGDNRVANGDFEECHLHENWSRPWLVYDLPYYNQPLAESGVVHAGDYAMRLHCGGTDDRCNTFQNIHVGPHEGYTVSFWYNTPFDLSQDSHFSVVCQEYDEDNPAHERWRALQIPGFVTPTDGWQHAEIEMQPDPLLPGSAIVRLHFRFQDESATIYVDDVELIPETLVAVSDPGEPDAAGTGPRAVFGLLGCRPNPCNPSVRISYLLAAV
ncbi:hypothetical protein KKA85_12080, partial [bacterium]|nr:hypothetical protein [bacterium]